MITEKDTFAQQFDNSGETKQSDDVQPNVALTPKKRFMEKLLYLISIGLIVGIIFTFGLRYYSNSEPVANQTDSSTEGVFEKTIVISNAPNRPNKPVQRIQTVNNTKTKRYLNLSEVDALITFDDGPHPDTTPHLIKLLKDHNIQQAIFFLVGYRILEYPHLVSLIDKAGYDIGYHSMFHENLTSFSIEKIEQDIQNFRKVLNSALGKRYSIKWGRPPFGGMTKATAKTFLQLESNGKLANTRIEELNSKLIKKNITKAFENQQLNLILWNVDFDDWELPVNTKIVDDRYSPILRQIWLFHERPVDWPNFKGFDNRLLENFQEFLNTLNDAYLRSQTIRRIQETLTVIGYNPGQIDGIIGDGTLSVIRKFQRDIGLPEDDNIHPEQLLKTLILEHERLSTSKIQDLVGP